MNLVGKSLAAVGVALLLTGCSSSQAPAAAPAVPVDQLTDVRQFTVPEERTTTTVTVTVGCYRGDRLYFRYGSYGGAMAVSGGACR